VAVGRPRPGKDQQLIIAVQNLSTLVSSQDAYDMTLLVDRQVRDHVAPAWGIQPPQVVFLAVAAGRKYDALIGILDDADQAGDLGWHTEGPDAAVYGRVFARPVLANGGNALTNQLSVCSVLSHEVIEVVGDAACNGWAQRADGSLAARELCDPVEGDSYVMTVKAAGETVSGTVSDFVFPAWFDPDAAGAPFDWMYLLSSPFQVRPSGYLIVMAGGTVTEQWGEEFPLWRLVTKEHPTARTARRDPSVVPVQNRPTSLA
jgi:hypothetical protein